MSTHAGGSSKRATAAPPTLGSKGGRVGRPPIEKRVVPTGDVAARIHAEARKIANLKTEHLIAVDRAGNVLDKTSNYKRATTAKQARYGTTQGHSEARGTRARGTSGHYEVHNHPSRFFNTFSRQDIRTVSQYKTCLGASVVQGHSLVTMYPRTDGTWPNWTKEIAPAFDGYTKERITQWTRDVRAGRMGGEAFDLKYEQLVNEGWEHAAKATGMRYVRERI